VRWNALLSSSAPEKQGGKRCSRVPKLCVDVKMQFAGADVFFDLLILKAIIDFASLKTNLSLVILGISVLLNCYACQMPIRKNP
jgi:hypothetical protein